MPVSDQLPGLIPRGREAETADHAIKAAFETEQQGLARDSLLLGRLGEIIGELLLQDAVDALYLLLLAKLDAVAGCFRTMVTAVLSGRQIAFFDGAGILEAAVSLEEELHAFAPAKPAFCIPVSSQCDLLFWNPII